MTLKIAAIENILAVLEKESQTLPGSPIMKFRAGEIHSRDDLFRMQNEYEQKLSMHLSVFSIMDQIKTALMEDENYIAYLTLKESSKYAEGWLRGARETLETLEGAANHDETSASFFSSIDQLYASKVTVSLAGEQSVRDLKARVLQSEDKKLELEMKIDEAGSKEALIEEDLLERAVSLMKDLGVSVDTPTQQD